MYMNYRHSQREREGEIHKYIYIYTFIDMHAYRTIQVQITYVSDGIINASQAWYISPTLILHPRVN